MFCRSLFVSVVFLLPLYYLPFFDLQIPFSQYFTPLTTFLISVFEDHTLIVKCRKTRKVLFIYFNLCLSVYLEKKHYFDLNICTTELKESHNISENEQTIPKKLKTNASLSATLNGFKMRNRKIKFIGLYCLVFFWWFIDVLRVIY